jgi:hypothetical protein
MVANLAPQGDTRAAASQAPVWSAGPLAFRVLEHFSRAACT